MNIIRRMINRLASIQSAFSNTPIGEWYAVSWDDERVFRKVHPPGKEPWADSLKWKDIIRICFESTDLAQSDGIYIFTSQRPESYLIPMEASGGLELLNEILKRKLFDPELATKAATATSGLFCWPNEN